MGGNGMDWHAWLSAARLEPALVYEYALVFARNELEADDVAYFDHEFLHSMGVSVAKHRLEILKLARLGRSRSRSRGRGRFPASSSPASLSRLLAAVDRVARYVLSLVHREESSALVLVPSQQQPDVPCSNSKRGGNKALKRTKSKPKGATSATRATVLAIGGRGAAMVHAIKDVEKGGGDGEEMVRWDRLFHDLKPN